MKTILKYISLLSATLLLTVGCDIIGGGNENPTDDGAITVSGPDAYTSDSHGGTITLSITSKKEWSAQSGQSWCKISPSNGEKGTYNITITLDENKEYDDRNAKVTFTTKNSAKNITVTQKQKDAIILTSDKKEISGKGGDFSVEVKSNVEFSYQVEKSSQSWIKAVEVKGLTTKVVNFTVLENEEFEKRQGAVIFTNGTIADTVDVYQDGALPTIVLSQNKIVVGSDGDEIQIEIRSNIDYEMNMPEGVTWMKVVETKAYSDYTHYIFVEANASHDSRSADIIFAGKGEYDVKDTVTIFQQQKDAIVVANTEYVVNAVDTELEFEINTNVEFDVEVSEGWVEYVPPTKGLEKYAMVFKIQENTTSEERSAVITIKSENVTQKVKVTQKGRVDKGSLSITFTNNVFTLPTIEGHNVQGVVYWGDDTSEEYAPNKQHYYSEKKQYVVDIDLWGAKTINVATLEGVEEIDLSDF